MAGGLVRGEPVAVAVERTARRQLDKVIRELERGDVDRAVHQTRRRLKRVRALMRLVRDGLPHGIFERDNRALADTADTLSVLRDAAVGLHAFDTLVAGLETGLVAPIRQALRARIPPAAGNGRPEVLAEAAAALRAFQQRMADWHLPPRGFATVSEGLERSYRQGRRTLAAAAAAAEPEAERFHDWRKRAKDLFYQTDFLAPLWPEPMAAMTEALDRLGDLLGDEHDLAVLRDAMLESGALEAEDRRGLILPRLHHRRQQLQRAALSLGARLYAERPGAFMRRMHAWWLAWAAEPADEQEAEEPG